MKSYLLVAALSFLAGVSLSAFVLAPTARLVPTLAARVQQLQKQVTEPKPSCAELRAEQANVFRQYIERIQKDQTQIDQLEQETSECASRCPNYVPDPKGPQLSFILKLIVGPQTALQRFDHY